MKMTNSKTNLTCLKRPRFKKRSEYECTAKSSVGGGSGDSDAVLIEVRLMVFLIFLVKNYVDKDQATCCNFKKMKNFFLTNVISELLEKLINNGESHKMQEIFFGRQ